MKQLQRRRPRRTAQNDWCVLDQLTGVSFKQSNIQFSLVYLDLFDATADMVFSTTYSFLCLIAVMVHVHEQDCFLRSDVPIGFDRIKRYRLSQIA